MEKEKLAKRQEEIINLVQSFCNEKLDAEYASLSEKIINKLGRKRNSPIATGQPKIWAAAVIHALGTINFLFDKSSKPYASIDDINDFFGTKKSTTGNKSKEIREMFKLKYWDKDFSTLKMLESSPSMNYVMVDGLIMHISSLPQEQQELVRKVRLEGGDISFTTR